MVQKGLKHFNDPWWDPLWATCQDLGVPIHWHAGAGIALRVPRWKGYTPNQGQAMGPAGGFSNQAQFIPNLIFSGVLDRFPKTALGVRRDRHRLGELHARDLRSRMGAPPPVDAGHRDAAQRALQAPDAA